MRTESELITELGNRSRVIQNSIGQTQSKDGNAHRIVDFTTAIELIKEEIEPFLALSNQELSNELWNDVVEHIADRMKYKEQRDAVLNCRKPVKEVIKSIIPPQGYNVVDFGSLPMVHHHTRLCGEQCEKIDEYEHNTTRRQNGIE